MNKQKGFLWILVDILVVAAIVGYFIYVNYPQLVTKTIFRNKTISSPAPVATPADWKTYTNSDYGFTLEYPENWKIIEESISETSSTIVKGQPFKIIQIKKGEGVNSEITINPEGLMVFSPNPEAQKVIGKVGEMNVTRYYFTNNVGAQVEWYRNFGNTKLTVFTIETYINKDDLKTVDKILSTFKFLDPEGRFCGGFAGETGESACPTGYICKYPSPMYPDASGKCVKI